MVERAIDSGDYDTAHALLDQDDIEAVGRTQRWRQAAVSLRLTLHGACCQDAVDIALVPRLLDAAKEAAK